MIAAIGRWGRNLGVFAILLIAAIGGAVAGDHYYEHHVGNWVIGVTAVAIGVGILAAVVVALFVIGWLLDSDENRALARRAVIEAVAVSLTIAGALAGIGAGYTYRDNGGSITAAVFVGIGSAIGAWLVASLLGLAVEMANSLRRIAVAAASASVLQAPGADPVPSDAVSTQEGSALSG
jgi:hypothetical protein